MDIYPVLVKNYFSGNMSLITFNNLLRILVAQTGKCIHIGFERYSLIHPRYYHIGNPSWYKGTGWYWDNTILMFRSYSAFLLDYDMVTDIEIDGIKLWLTQDGFAHYENVRQS